MRVFELEIERLNHDCFRIQNNKTVYFDPFRVERGTAADLVLISHEHYDHCSPDDLKKIISKKTVIVASRQCEQVLSALESAVDEIIYLHTGDMKEVRGIKIEAVAAYNTNKFRAPGQPFHPKQDEKLGFVVTIDGTRIYHAGDSDFIPEMKNLKNIDVAFLPVSGTYVMTAEEAAEAAKTIIPKIAIPMHYGAIVGNRENAERFAKLAGSVKVEIL